MAGDIRCVRAPRPWRPRKLRLVVEAQRLPGSTLSPFIATHIEHPASTQSRPALMKTTSSPSASACFLICADPGETSDLAESHAEKYEELLEIWRDERRKLGIVLPQDL